MLRQLKGILLLLITTMIWGLSFVAQRTSVDAIEAFTFNTGRMCSAFVTMVIIVAIRYSRDKSGIGPAVRFRERDVIIGGLLCGAALFAGNACMQIGIMTTGAGKTGFETALYIIEVPLFGMLTGQKPRKVLWLCVALALTGLWLLAVRPGESMALARGDVILFIGTVFFALQIMFMDHYVKKADPFAISTVQMAVGAVLFPICMMLFEEPDWSSFTGELVPMLYAGVMASAVGFTLAAFAQRTVDPTVTSLVMSLEGVFAVIGGWLIIDEYMTIRELLGCALMFTAIIITQLPKRSTC